MIVSWGLKLLKTTLYAVGQVCGQADQAVTVGKVVGNLSQEESLMGQGPTVS